VSFKRPSKPKAMDITKDSSTEQVAYEKDKEFRESSSDQHVVSEDYEHHQLHRGLKARHMSMIAIGGAIGTGLIIGR
jgi:yeast amino acid transporter